MTMKLASIRLLATCLLAAVLCGPATAQTLRFAFNEDVDTLDPTLSRGFTARIVMTAICDKLIEVTPDLQFVPQLATGWSWSDDRKSLTLKLRPGVLFQDGEKMDAAAVKASLDRHREMAGSQRKAELAPVTSVEVVDDLTVRIDTSTVFVPLIGYLADRAGMILSPKAIRELGDRFTAAPVCAGPFKFAGRVPQDHVTVERFDRYWASDRVKLARIEFKTLPDPAVRLANLRSGQFDIVERVAATDAKGLRADTRFQVVEKEEIGWNGLYLNVASERRGPLSDPRVREALDLSIDRAGLVQALSNGEFVPGNQWVPPSNPAYDKAIPVPRRDVARAKALLAEAGQPRPTVTLTTPNFTEAVQFSQIVQAMAREAGFDMRVQTLDYATMLDATARGEFEALVIYWSGRADPDGSIYTFVTCGAPLNLEKYCSRPVDDALNAARQTTDEAERRRHWADAASILVAKDRPLLFIFHRKYIWGVSRKVGNFVPYPDGVIRYLDLMVD